MTYSEALSINEEVLSRKEFTQRAVKVTDALRLNHYNHQGYNITSDGFRILVFGDEQARDNIKAAITNGLQSFIKQGEQYQIDVNPEGSNCYSCKITKKQI